MGCGHSSTGIQIHYLKLKTSGLSIHRVWNLPNATGGIVGTCHIQVGERARRFRRDSGANTQRLEWLGRTAEGDVTPIAAVYAYSRSQGLFAGVSVEGVALDQRRGERGILRPVGPSETDTLRESQNAGGAEASKGAGEVLGRRLSQPNQGLVGGEQD